jgi:phosphoadenosine phosphosulfate reductase
MDSLALRSVVEEVPPADTSAQAEPYVDPVVARVRALERRYRGVETRALLDGLINTEFPGRIAVVSSFGIEAAVLLHLVASVAPSAPIVFLDTGKLFGETLRYRDTLVKRLGLSDVRSIGPDARDVAAEDPDGVLWSEEADRCCFIRKVLPLRRALAGFDAWINGRKGYQGGRRAGLATLEAADGRVKVNPLAAWTRADIEASFARHLYRLHALLEPHAAGRGSARRPLARALQVGVRHPPRPAVLAPARGIGPTSSCARRGGGLFSALSERTFRSGGWRATGRRPRSGSSARRSSSSSSTA